VNETETKTEQAAATGIPADTPVETATPAAPQGGAVDQDALMAEWEAMSNADQGAEADKGGGDGLPGSATPPRALGQDEIDALMGVAGQDEDPSTLPAIQRILKNTKPKYEALPILEFVFDRLVRFSTSSLRNITGGGVEVYYDGGETKRFGDYMRSVKQPSMLVVFKAVEWENQGLMMIDDALINSMIDVMLGGSSAPPCPPEGRDYTAIERALIERLAQKILEDLSRAFQPVSPESPITFNFERIETNERFAYVTRKQNAVRVANFRVDMVERGRGGSIQVMLPYATLEPVSEVLRQMYMGEKLGKDTFWEGHLKGELAQTNFVVSALLGEVTVPLGEIVRWRPGTEIHLPLKTGDNLPLLVDNKEMFQVSMGKRNGHVAVKIESGDSPSLSEFFKS